MSKVDLPTRNPYSPPRASRSKRRKNFVYGAPAVVMIVVAIFLGLVGAMSLYDMITYVFFPAANGGDWEKTWVPLASVVLATPLIVIVSAIGICVRPCLPRLVWIAILFACVLPALSLVTLLNIPLR